MMELVDMPGRSILVSVSRLWTCHLKRVGGGFRVPFCDPTEGVLEFSFGDVFCMGDDPLRKKSDLKNQCLKWVRAASTHKLHAFKTGFGMKAFIEQRRIVL